MKLTLASTAQGTRTKETRQKRSNAGNRGTGWFLTTLLLLAALIGDQGVDANCNLLELPYIQKPTTTNVNAEYLALAIETEAESYDAALGGYTYDDSNNFLFPILTYLEEAQSYEAMWSYYINDVGSSKIVDVSFDLYGQSLLFVLEGLTDSSTLHFGTVDLTGSATNPTVSFYEFLSGGGNFVVTPGANFGSIEDKNTVYMAMRGPEFDTASEINYAKLNLLSNTVTWHLTNPNNKGLDGATISLITGEKPAASVFISGFQYAIKGQAITKALWIVKAKVSDGQMVRNFAYTWKDADWAALNVPNDSIFRPDRMDYNAGYLYCGGTMQYQSTVPANSPIMLFYLNSSDMSLQSNALIYITIQGYIMLKGVNIQSKGILTAFMQAVDSKGYYMTLNLDTQTVINFREIAFFDQGQAAVNGAISFTRGAQQEFWYAGQALSNICSGTVETQYYGYVTKLETACPCLADPESTSAYTLVTDTTHDADNFDPNYTTDHPVVAKSSSLTVLTSSSVTAVTNLDSFVQICSTENIPIGNQNCECSHVLHDTFTSPIFTKIADDTTILEKVFTEFQLAFPQCTTNDWTYKLNCFTDSTYTVTQVCPTSISIDASVPSIKLGDPGGNAFAGTFYTQLEGTNSLDQFDIINFFYIIELALDPCDDGYPGTDECTDPCGFNYVGVGNCSPCSGTYPATGTDTCEPCDEFYSGAEACTPCSIRYSGAETCTPCQAGYVENGGTDECNSCDENYSGADPCNACIAGYTGPLTCEACDFGYVGAEICTPCSIRAPDPENCDPCAAAYSGPLTCSPCDPSYSGADSCTACQDRYVGAGECNPCTPGPGYTGTDECTPCFSGYIGADTCSPCDDGAPNPENCGPCFDRYIGLLQCLECDLGYSGPLTCDPCSIRSPEQNKCDNPCSDQYLGNDACSACFDGYLGTEICTPCTKGYVGATACDDKCSKQYAGAESCDDPCSQQYKGEEQCDRFKQFEPEEEIIIEPFAPYFDTEDQTNDVPKQAKPNIIECDLGERCEHQLPRIIAFQDVEEGIEFTCIGAKTNQLVYYDPTRNLFDVHAPSGFAAGIYTIFCELYDSQNSKELGINLKRSYVFSISISESSPYYTGNWRWTPEEPTPPVSRPTPSPDDSFKGIAVPEFLPPLYATIKDISFNGLMKIQFTQNLRPVKVNQIDETVIEIYINGDIKGTYRMPPNETASRQLQLFTDDSESQNRTAVYTEQLDFTWYPVAFYNSNTLEVQIKFVDPLQVSLRDQIDSIELKFKQTDQFVRWGYDVSQIPTGYKIDKGLPPQLDKDTGEKFETFEYVLYLVTVCILAVYFVIMTLLGARKDYMWTFIHTMQIYVHFLLMDLKFSANAYVLMQRFMDPMRLMIVPSVSILERFFGIEGNSGLSQVFNQAGYDSTNMARLQAYLNVDFFLLALFVFLIWFSQFFLKLLNRAKIQKITDLSRRVAWQATHRLLLLGTIELMLCPTIFLMGGKTKLWFSVFLCILSFCALFYLICAVVYATMLNKEEILEGDKEFSERFSTFFAVVRHKAAPLQTKMSLAYYAIFIVRRAFFVAILTSLRLFPGQQLQLCLALFTCHLIYLGWFKPIVEKWHMAFEIVDECILIMITYMMLQFSDYYPDSNVQARYKVGTAVNSLVVFHIVYHLGVLVCQLVYTVIYRIYAFWIRKDAIKKIKRAVVPQRGQDDIHFPYDCTEFSKKQAAKTLNEADDDLAWDKKQRLEDAVKDLTPKGHPLYIEKNVLDEKMETISEYSQESTIKELSIEIIEQIETIVMKPHTRYMEEPETCEFCEEPLDEGTDDQGELRALAMMSVPGTEDTFDFGRYYNSDSRMKVRDHKEAGLVPIHDQETVRVHDEMENNVGIEFMHHKSESDFKLYSDESAGEISQRCLTLQTHQSPLRGGSQYPNSVAPSVMASDRGLNQIMLFGDNDQMGSPESVNVTGAINSSQRFLNTINQLSSSKERSPFKQAQEETKGDGVEPGKGKYMNNKFFRALASNMQRKSVFSSIKAHKGKTTFRNVAAMVVSIDEEEKKKATLNGDLGQAGRAQQERSASPKKRFELAMTKMIKQKINFHISPNKKVISTKIGSLAQAASMVIDDSNADAGETILTTGGNDKLFSADKESRTIDNRRQSPTKARLQKEDHNSSMPHVARGQDIEVEMVGQQNNEASWMQVHSAKKHADDDGASSQVHVKDLFNSTGESSALGLGSGVGTVNIMEGTQGAVPDDSDWRNRSSQIVEVGDFKNSMRAVEKDRSQLRSGAGMSVNGSEQSRAISHVPFRNAHLTHGATFNNIDDGVKDMYVNDREGQDEDTDQNTDRYGETDRDNPMRLARAKTTRSRKSRSKKKKPPTSQSGFTNNTGLYESEIAKMVKVNFGIGLKDKFKR